MAKKGKLENNKLRKKLVEQYQSVRAELRKICRDPSVSLDEKLLAQKKLQSLPRNSIAIRIRNRCEISGRPRAYYRKFKISRIAFREMALRGELPGVTKSSW